MARLESSQTDCWATPSGISFIMEAWWAENASLLMSCVADDQKDINDEYMKMKNVKNGVFEDLCKYKHPLLLEKYNQERSDIHEHTPQAITL